MNEYRRQTILGLWKNIRNHSHLYVLNCSGLSTKPWGTQHVMLLADDWLAMWYLVPWINHFSSIRHIFGNLILRNSGSYVTIGGFYLSIHAAVPALQCCKCLNVNVNVLKRCCYGLLWTSYCDSRGCCDVTIIWAISVSRYVHGPERHTQQRKVTPQHRHLISVNWGIMRAISLLCVINVSSKLVVILGFKQSLGI